MIFAENIISVVMPVYRDGLRALTAARELLKQVLPDGTTLEVVVVDDGSSDDIAKLFHQCRDPRLQLLRLPINEGRSAARNAGARKAKGEIIVFIDCDCLPTRSDFLAAHVSALQDSQVASTGHVIGADAGFWSRYQQQASLRRRDQYAHGATYAGSSQNLAVRRSAFEKIGEFDIEFKHYGFEDRDVLLRLSEIGTVIWTARAVVRHLDKLTLTEVSRKMATAGEYSAERFAERHPAAYKTLGYSAIDARLHPWLRPVGRTLGRLALTSAPYLDRLLERMPFPIAKIIVKTTSALAFLQGTTRDHLHPNV